MLRKVAAAFLLIFAAIGCQSAYAGQKSSKDGRLILPFIGYGRGTYEASVGVFAWTDKLWLRNLSLRGDVDLLPGVRLHTIIRSNDEFNSIGEFDPKLDEAYIEGYGFYKSHYGDLSASLRLGSIRYLRFPYPDDIALFDQVPGVNDLTTRVPTGYNGALLSLDYAHGSGLGLHVTGFNGSLLEGYVSYHKDIGFVELEARAGALALRSEPLGRSDGGYSAYLGFPLFGMKAGLLYEKLESQPIRTGIKVEFPLNPVTKILGRYGADYARSPKGVAATIPLVSGTIGDFSKTPPEGSVLVGEVKAERIRTYWMNSQIRNFYEHRLSSWGETSGPDIVAVMDEEPWYLQCEALVSPHNSFASLENLEKWERGRQGPAQVSQGVTYRFYRRP